MIKWGKLKANFAINIEMLMLYSTFLFENNWLTFVLAVQKIICLYQNEYKNELSQKIRFVKINCLEIKDLTSLKVHKIEIFFGFDFEICIIL